MGNGKYRVNHEKYAAIVKIDPLDPKSQISIENLIDYTGEEWENPQIRKKVQSVLQKINLDIAWDEHFVKQIRNLEINEKLKEYGFMGKWLINKKIARRLRLHNIWFAGTVSKSSLRNYRISNFAVMSMVILSASVYVAYYNRGIMDENKSIKDSIPTIIPIEENYPISEVDPFYEIITDFPDILESARNEAARVLKTNLHYRLDINTIEKHKDELKFLLHQGTLKTHGFIKKISRELTKLYKESEELFLDLVFKSGNLDIPIVGISRISHDRYIQKVLKTEYGIKVTDTNDLNFLMSILEDGDATCLIHRPVEKGRMKINNWYEFYFKREPNVFKIELISNHPEEDYKEILDILYTNTIPAASNDIDAGPGVISAAELLCSRHNGFLSEEIAAMIRSALHSGVQDILG